MTRYPHAVASRTKSHLVNRPGRHSMMGLRFGQIFDWDGIIRVFRLPEDSDNPPAFAIVHQLDAIDPAGKRFGIGGIASRFIRAENMRDVAEDFSLARDF